MPQERRTRSGRTPVPKAKTSFDTARWGLRELLDVLVVVYPPCKERDRLADDLEGLFASIFVARMGKRRER